MKKILLALLLVGIVTVSGCTGSPVYSDEESSDQVQVEPVQENQEICTPNWECGQWSECSPSGTQTRSCVDANNCGVTTDKPTESGSCTPEVQETTVQTLELFLAMGKSWDADADPDGIEVTIMPKDRDDDLVKTAGTLSAKLYYREYDDEFNAVKGDFIEEWTNIQVTKSDYGFMGAEIRLEYKSGFVPKGSDYGWLDVTLITPDGKSFSAKYDIVMLS
ncbi:MAG: hypothetical protein GOV02_02675 [Candidatus Aenigmarchaeota archaeon]|nr:hypothetical protein [Candidatus Aenigmarchaeota archaeon]